jgi:hypothetical protein
MYYNIGNLFLCVFFKEISARQNPWRGILGMGRAKVASVDEFSIKDNPLKITVYCCDSPYRWELQLYEL